MTLGSTDSSEAEHSSQNLDAIGSAIRNLRKERGLNLRDLSRRSGLSTGFLSLVERGLSSPALTSLQAIAKALETNKRVDLFQTRRGASSGLGIDSPCCARE